jgi:hypothetical protein
MTTVIVSPAMTRKAEKLAARVPFMSRGRSKVNGITFYIVPGSKAGTAWWSNGLGCNCPGFTRSGVCTHSLAVSIHQTRESEKRIAAAQAATPKRKTYSQLVPVCPVVGCDDDALRSGYCLGHRSLATVAS